MFDMHLNPLRSGSNQFLKKALFTEKPPVFDSYSRARLPIGFVRDYYRRERDMKKIFCLDLSEAIRMLFVAKTRTGKSFALRGICDRLTECKNSVVYLTDVKNEYETSVRPLQLKFRHKLIKNEKPKGYRMKVFRPTFFQYLEGHASLLPAGQEWYSMDISKLQPRDFTTLLRFLGLTDGQCDSMERALFEAKQQHVEIRTFEDFERIIEDAEYIEGSGRIINKLHKIIYYNPFDPNHRVSPSQCIKDGNNLVFNLQYFDSLEKDNGFLQVCVASVIRNIVSARIAQQIPPVWLVVDETPRFCPANGDTSARHDILESVDTHTAYDVNWIFASQDIESIPERLVKQCKVIFCPSNIDYHILKEVFKMAGLSEAEVKSQQYNELRRVTERMGRFDWLAIDTSEKYFEAITFLPPLSEAKQTE